MPSREDLNALLQSTADVLFPGESRKRRIRLDTRGLDGDSPLHVLLWRGDDRGAETLIQAGADVNAVGDMGHTPLHVAVRKGNPRLVRALLRAGAAPDIVSAFGDTPREAAQEIGGAALQAFIDSGA